MRVALVNPPPYQRVDQYDEPDFTRLGLACLATPLLRNGHHVSIIDAKFEKLSTPAVVERVLEFRPDVVGLTAFTNEVKPAAAVAKQLKAASRDILTVIGGPHVSAIPVDTLGEFEAFDYGVTGEGELSFLALVEALGAGTTPSSIPGVVLRGAEGPVARVPAQAPSDLDALGFPAWQLLPPGPRFLVMTQRGCPFRCTFCQNPNGRLVRQRSIPHVIEELTEITGRYGAREIMFCDEIFTVDMDRTRELLEAMIQKGLERRLRFWAQTHVNVVDRELFALLKRAGCHHVGLGIETGDPERQRAMKKGITFERVIAARQAAADAKLPVESFLLIGHPHETWESAMRTIDFAVKLNPEVPILGVIVPYPGTALGEMARRGEGGFRLISTDWNAYNKQLGHAMELEHLSRRDIELLQMIGYCKIFLANHRYADFARFVWQYRSEGWAVVRKIVEGRMPAEPAEAAELGPKPYFARATLAAPKSS